MWHTGFPPSRIHYLAIFHVFLHRYQYLKLPCPYPQDGELSYVIPIPVNNCTSSRGNLFYRNQLHPLNAPFITLKGIRALLCLKKPPCRRQGSLLIMKWICPIHAEPVQVDAGFTPNYYPTHCKKHKKAAGILLQNPDQIERIIADGFNFLALGTDIGIITKGFKSRAEAFDRFKKV